MGLQEMVLAIWLIARGVEEGAIVRSADGLPAGTADRAGLTVAKPDETAMSNVACFMCDLVTEPRVWGEWNGQLPVIVDAASQ